MTSPDSIIQLHRGENLRTQAERIIAKSGVKPWPRLFQNLRSSFETDLTARVPLHVACMMCGNTAAVALGHYLQVTDEHFDQARGESAKSGAGGEFEIKGRSHPTRKSGSLRGFTDLELTPTGLAQPRHFAAFLRIQEKTLRKARQRLIRALPQMRAADIAVLTDRVDAARRRVARRGGRGRG